MSRPPTERTKDTPVAARGALRHGWIAVLAVALGLLAWDTVATVRHYSRASANYGVAVRAPAVDPSSPTGFADGVRDVVYPGISLDAQLWIMQTQDMVAAGALRVRSMSADNAGEPRPVHWGSPFRWWLACCGWIEHTVSGRPIGSAIERAALWANPLLLGLLMLGLVPWVARRWGGGAAAFLALAMVGTPLFQVLFAGDNPDHHGLIQACLLVCMFALMGGGAGWVRRQAVAESWLPEGSSARRMFTVSAVAGAASLWVSAASTIPAFVGMGLGALLAAWLGRGGSEVAQYEPKLWRRWGLVGGLATLLAFLLEYAPGDFSWRLEVIHPLYAVAWAGAGEVLTRMTSALSRGRLVPDGAEWGPLGLGLVAVAVPVGVILLAGERVFSVGDAFFWALTHDYVPEVRSLFEVWRHAGFNVTTIVDCLPMLVLPVVAVGLSRRATPPLTRAIVILPLAGAAVFWLLGFREMRWWILSFGYLFAAVVLVLAPTAAPTSPRGRRERWIFVLMLFVPGVVTAIHTMTGPRALSREDLFSLVERDLAHVLRQRAGDGPVVVLGGPATVTRLTYFGGLDGVGSCYWENVEAMKRAAAIFAAGSWDQAHALVRAGGITHIVLLSWDNFAEPYVRLARGLPVNAAIPGWALGTELQRTELLPPWLRRLPDHRPDIPPLRDQHVLIYEVTERTSPAQALTRQVNSLVYRGQAAAAGPLRAELARFPDDLAAQVALARLEGVLQNDAGFARALSRVEALLGQVSGLEPEDRINLVILFAYGGRETRARNQLAAIVAEFDESALRQLTPGALMNLLTLSERLNVSWPDAAKRDFAIALAPPDGRP